LAGSESIDQTVIEDNSFSFKLPTDAFVDPEGLPMTYRVSGPDNTALPSWISFNPITRTFSGTPDNNAVGVQELVVTAYDDLGVATSRSFFITVQNVNDAPVVNAGIGTVNVVQNQSLNYTIPADAFSDIDPGDLLSFSVTLADGSDLPSWLTFDAATATLSGTPGNDQVGTLALLVTAADLAGATVSTGFSLDIANVNDTPTTADPFETLSVIEDQTFSYQIPADTFADIDAGDQLTLTATMADGSGLPDWLTFDTASGTLTGTPGNDQVGTIELLVTATDISGAAVSAGLSLAVANTNDAPELLTPLADQSAKQGQLFSYSIPADAFIDIDAGDQLTFSATLDDGSSLPVWLTLDATTGTFSGTPGSSDLGSINVTVTATDMAGAAVCASFSLSVTGGNSAPIATPNFATLTEDRCPPYVTGNLLANDSDPDTGDTLTIADPGFVKGDYGYLGVSSDGKYGYLLNNASYEVQSLGRTAQVVDHFNYTVTDGKAQVASSLDITIKGSNDAPIVAHRLADQSVKNNKSFSFTMPADSFVDIDKGDTLTYTATTTDGKALPSWLKFDATTGTFSGIAPKNAGYLNIKVTATDKVAATGSTEGSLSASDIFQLSFGKRGPTCNDEEVRHNDDFDWIRKHHAEERYDGDQNDRRFISFNDEHDHNHKDDRATSRPIHYLDSKQLDDYLSEFEHPSAGTDRAMAARWQTVSEALERELSSFDNDFSSHRKQSGGFDFMGSNHGFGRGITANCQLTAGSGTELKEFKGLKEGMQRLG